MRRLGENGFTAQELLAVALIIIVCIVPSLFLLHQQTYSSQLLAGQRRLAVAELMQEIHSYVTATGHLPADVPSKMEPIGSATNQVNLCNDLAPVYTKALPADPVFGGHIKCSENLSYESGLGIEKTGKGTQVIIAALGSAASKLIYLID